MSDLILLSLLVIWPTMLLLVFRYLGRYYRWVAPIALASIGLMLGSWALVVTTHDWPHWLIIGATGLLAAAVAFVAIMNWK
jgi:hypothetical protein